MKKFFPNSKAWTIILIILILCTLGINAIKESIEASPEWMEWLKIIGMIIGGTVLFIGFIVILRVMKVGAEVLEKALTNDVFRNVIAFSISITCGWLLVAVMLHEVHADLSSRIMRGILAGLLAIAIFKLVGLLFNPADEFNKDRVIKLAGYGTALILTILLEFGGLKVYAYFSPRYINPTSEELKAEVMIDPDGNIFEKNYKRNPDTTDPLTPYDKTIRQKVNEKKQQNLKTLKEIIQTIFKTFPTPVQKPNTVYHPQKEDIRNSFVEIIQPPPGTVVKPGNTVFIEWRGYVPESESITFSCKTKDWESAPVQEISSSQKIIRWQVPYDTGEATCFIGVYDKRFKYDKSYEEWPTRYYRYYYISNY